MSSVDVAVMFSRYSTIKKIKNSDIINAMFLNKDFLINNKSFISVLVHFKSIATCHFEEVREKNN